MNELELRQKAVEAFKSWIGCNEADGSFKKIIDLYNTQTPLPVGYKLKYSDEWCAGCVTAAGIKAGLSKIILGECSCSRMISLYQAKGLWQERDDYKPTIGDLIMYDWEDGENFSTTDNKGAPNHVGMVVGVNGNTLTIIEGNKGNGLVGYRNVQVNGRYIRGYCLPDYKSLATQPSTETHPNSSSKEEAHFSYLKDVPPSYQSTIRKVMSMGYLRGYSDPDSSSLEDNFLDISETFCRVMVVLDKAGILK